MNGTQLRHFWRTNWLLLCVFLTATAVALWFGIHMLASFIYFNDPRHQDVALKGWMTPRYIVLAYDLPRPLVLETLQLPPNVPGGRPLYRVAADLGLSLNELTELVRDVADTHRGAAHD